ncbi:ATP synthase F1 subunit delta [Desulfuromonas sp. AOP6]|uniref:ATP synthase F1 subunit delta n=1 Tax=Desulfuromonas sp. AOP6 TaxID=1566351 RepID=UPI00126AC9BE|nr:ATP synthase F1 subunit delta [Desulfuromonas sp. AOP6]BCA81203.1 ATP synthase subunit delta [Desulfuromonas sp. AOP6]
MSISAISRRYAKALVNLGAEQKMVEGFGQELAKVSTVFASEDSLRLILESPTFPLAKKAAILQEVTKSLGLSKGVSNFLGLLLENDRLKFLSLIEGDYRKLADELSGVLRAKLKSASPLAEEQVKAIASALEKNTGKRIDVTMDVDPALIGGLQAEIAGQLFDGSIKTQLKRIEDTLKKG